MDPYSPSLLHRPAVSNMFARCFVGVTRLEPHRESEPDILPIECEFVIFASILLYTVTRIGEGSCEEPITIAAIDHLVPGPSVRGPANRQACGTQNSRKRSWHRSHANDVMHAPDENKSKTGGYF